MESSQGQRPILAAILATLILVSGCAGSEKPSGRADTIQEVESADSAEPTKKQGSIRGLVADDEAYPIEGAAVILFGAAAGGGDLKTRTTADGRFVYNDVEPGKYRLLADMDGYKSNGGDVTVTAGSVAEPAITLTKVAKKVVRPDYFWQGTGSIDGPVVLFESPASPNEQFFDFPVEAWPEGDAFVNVTWNGGPTGNNYLNVDIYDSEGVEIVQCRQGSEVINCGIGSFPTTGTYKARVRAWTGYDIDFEISIFVPYYKGA